MVFCVNNLEIVYDFACRSVNRAGGLHPDPLDLIEADHTDRRVGSWRAGENGRLTE
jgi:hypothetical protein